MGGAGQQGASAELRASRSAVSHPPIPGTASTHPGAHIPTSPRARSLNLLLHAGARKLHFRGHADVQRGAEAPVDLIRDGVRQVGLAGGALHAARVGAPQLLGGQRVGRDGGLDNSCLTVLLSGGGEAKAGGRMHQGASAWAVGRSGGWMHADTCAGGGRASGRQASERGELALLVLPAWHPLLLKNSPWGSC